MFTSALQRGGSIFYPADKLVFEDPRRVCGARYFMREYKFKELLKSINQAREIRRGRRSPRLVFHYEPVKVKKIREKLHLTQEEFARRLCVSLGTLRNWEQGRSSPASTLFDKFE